MAVKLKTKSEVKTFLVPVLDWEGVTIDLSHLTTKESNDQYIKSYIKSGIKGDMQEYRSTPAFLRQNLPIMLSHIHGWGGIIDDSTNEPLPFNEVNLNSIIEQYGDAPIDPKVVYEIRKIIKEMESEIEDPESENGEKKKVDLTPTTLMAWIRWIQGNRYAFDYDFENLSPTATHG